MNAFGGQTFQISGIEPREEVELHLVPDGAMNLVEVRIWDHRKLVHRMNLPVAEFGNAVHF